MREWKLQLNFMPIVSVSTDDNNENVSEDTDNVKALQGLLKSDFYCF